MNCLSQAINYFFYGLEELGFYEPELTIEEAKDRLALEKKRWEDDQEDRDLFWSLFQKKRAIDIPPLPLVTKAIHLLQKDSTEKKVAVDLGCGISPTTIHLLKKGWKVYAVDSSQSVLE